jgi:hypothetical protein
MYSTRTAHKQSHGILKPCIENDIIDLLVVLEPGRRKLKNDKGTYTDWAVRNICEDDARAMLRNTELRDFIHEEFPDESTRPGTIRVRIFETVSALSSKMIHIIDQIKLTIAIDV